MEHFFSPNSGGDLRSDAHQSQIIGGDADVDHTQIIGRDISPIPQGLGTPDCRSVLVQVPLAIAKFSDLVRLRTAIAVGNCGH